MTKTVFCKILEHEIPLKRCKPLKDFRVCESYEGYKLKASRYMRKKNCEKKEKKNMRYNG
jgi:hypothetical protein